MELTLEEATQFFSDFYGGEHHIPGFKPKPFGLGWCVSHDRGDLATYDFTGLTKLVLMGHDRCIRVSVQAKGKNVMEIAIHKRQRDGSMSSRHPTIETAIENFRS